MSSIYRKGRDGYFYYQTYVYNKKTGKKDKRIFHSLGTKNLVEAQEKKKKLDEDYLDKSELAKKGSGYFSYNSIFKYALVFCISFFLSSFFIQPKVSLDQEPNKVNEKNLNSNQIGIIQEISLDTLVKNSFKDSVIISESLEEKIILATELVNNKIIESAVDSLKSIKYNVERLEVLSGAFKQAKIHVTIKSKSANSASLNFICNDVIKKYNDFSSFIVCIYDNSEMGKSLANGLISLRNRDPQNKAWLAMYTYNPVEGAFFDDNPLKIRENF